MVQQQLAELKVCRAAGCLPGLGSGVGSRGQGGARGISWRWDEGAVCWTEPVPPAPARGLQRVARTCPRCPKRAGLLALHEEELWAQVPVPSCARLCQAVPRHSKLCCAMASCTVVCCTQLCRAMLCHTKPSHAVPCHLAVPTMPCHAVPCHAVPCLMAPQVRGSVSEGQGPCATTHLMVGLDNLEGLFQPTPCSDSTICPAGVQAGALPVQGGRGEPTAPGWPRGAGAGGPPSPAQRLPTALGPPGGGDRQPPGEGARAVRGGPRHGAGLGWQLWEAVGARELVTRFVTGTR